MSVFLVFRCEFISLTIGRLSVKTAEEDRKLTHTASSFSAKLDVLAKQVEEHVGIEGLPDSVKEKIKDEARQYFKTGSCVSLKDESRGFLNPTMLHPTTRKWQVNVFLSPFYGYIPLVKEEQLDTSVNSGILTRSCLKILKALVSSYRKKMHLVQIFVHLEDSLEFCYRQTIKFDVIDSSYLPDFVGLTNIVNACSKILSDHPEAKFFTCTTMWADLAPTIHQYVEKALCTPLSLIPTYYGLRLMDHVELGASTLVNLRKKQHPFNLCWKKAPLYRNLSLTPCETMTAFLQDLAQLCFDHKVLRKYSGLLPGDECGMMLNSPRTFYYVMNALMERIGGDEKWLDARDLRLPRYFSVIWLALKAWLDGQPVLKLSTRITSSALKKTYLSSCIGSPVLRIVLWPLSNSGVPLEQLQYIDNFEFKMEKDATDEITSVFVSFLLPLDNDIEEKYAASIVDFVNGHDIISIGPLKSFQMEKVRGSYSYPLKTTSLETDSATEENASQMVVLNCIEDEFKYVLKIKVEGHDDLAGEFVANLLVSFTCTFFKFVFCL